MKQVTYALALSAMALTGQLAGATEVSGDQWGTWTLDQSPYELIGDVTVPTGETLSIEPGVVVNAHGHYRITVDGSTLLAVGAADQPILMTAENHDVGWRGLRLLNASDDSVVSHCIIEYARGIGAYPEVRGGAIYCQDCSPTISHNELRYNYSHNDAYNGCGAGVATESSSALVVDNFIHDNWADSGGGICCMEYGTPVLKGNVVVDNGAYYAGGGMYFGARSSPLVENNVIVHNQSGGWGGGGINSWTSYIYYGTYATIRNNLIAGNTAYVSGEASGGGGIYARYDRCILTNNTIVDNASTRGGGIYAINYEPQAPIVTNCIVWGNTASVGPQIYLLPDTGSWISVSYSDVAGGWAGAGNLNEDPAFADPEAEDYHLSTESPCIDAGDPAFVPQPGETDIDGQFRVWDGDATDITYVDMGADEFGSFVYGDVNCDGAVNFFDIDAFVMAIIDPTSYPAAYPGCELELADCNGDGDVDAFDIDPFVALLTG